MATRTNFLGLVIIEGTDYPDFAVLNQNANQIDSFCKTTNTSVTNSIQRLDSAESRLGIIDEQITNINDVNNQQAQKIATLETNVKKLQDVASIETIVVDGVEKQAEHHLLKLEVDNYNSSSVGARMNIVGNDEYYLFVGVQSTSLAINLSEMLGLSRDSYKEKFILKNIETYADDYLYMGKNNPCNLHVRAIGTPPNSTEFNSNDVYMFMTGSNSSAIRINKDSQYTGSIYTQEGNIFIVLEYLIIKE